MDCYSEVSTVPKFHSMEPGPYYVQTTDDIVKCLVNSLTREANIKRRNLSTDRFYTSIEIANWLLEKNVTCVGTIKRNR